MSTLFFQETIVHLEDLFLVNTNPLILGQVLLETSFPDSCPRSKAEG